MLTQPLKLVSTLYVIPNAASHRDVETGIWNGNETLGLIHLTRMMATTLVETKIRVNCIAPGIFPSEMTAGSSGDDQKSKLDMQMSNPAGKIHIMLVNVRNSLIIRSYWSRLRYGCLHLVLGWAGWSVP